MQRSKREGSEMGFAARKHTETDLRMQRSGQERAVVGFAERGAEKKIADSNNEADDRLLRWASL